MSHEEVKYMDLLLNNLLSVLYPSYIHQSVIKMFEVFCCEGLFYDMHVLLVLVSHQHTVTSLLYIPYPVL